jgi:hypothetical protein
MNQDNGGVIGKINTPTQTVASGVWSIEQQFEAQSSSIWPLAFPQTTIANSLRFDDGSSDYLTRTFGSSATSDKIGTYSSWIKRSTLGEKDLFSAPGGGNRGFIRFEGDDQLRTRTLATANEVKTSMKFRDLSAWYHIVIAYDTTQSTASNRVKIYINGNQQTDLSATTYPSQNSSIYWGQNGIQTEIGYDIFDGGSGYYDGYTAEVVWIDGQALDPTSFGAFNPVTNIWEPIAYTGTYGNNGFRLDFADSSALGNDVSGNDNDFTVNNLTSVDQSTDTCSNNFAVLNPLVTLSGGTLSEGNLKYNYGSNGWRSSFSTIGAKKGKWYCEAKFDSGTHLIVGIVDEDGYSRNSGNFLADSTFNYSNGYAYYSNDGSKNATGKDGQATSASYGNSFAAGDIIGIAMDLDNGKLYFSKNGTFQDSGDPTSGSTGTGSAYNITNSTTSNYFFGVSPYNATVSLNTGSPSFSISSGNADANGHGNFEYAVPSGYFALNTKNLSEFG